jgi:hypothetical protein
VFSDQLSVTSTQGKVPIPAVGVTLVVTQATFMVARFLEDERAAVHPAQLPFRDVLKGQFLLQRRSKFYEHYLYDFAQADVHL